MFGIGTSELIVILVLALLIVGPKELPKVGRELGKVYKSFQRTTHEVKESIAREMKDVSAEVEGVLDEKEKDEKG